MREVAWSPFISMLFYYYYYHFLQAGSRRKAKGIMITVSPESRRLVGVIPSSYLPKRALPAQGEGITLVRSFLFQSQDKSPKQLRF